MQIQRENFVVVLLSYFVLYSLHYFFFYFIPVQRFMRPHALQKKKQNNKMEEEMGEEMGEEMDARMRGCDPNMRTQHWIGGGPAPPEL